MIQRRHPGKSRSGSLLALVGVGHSPFSLTPEERVLEAYYERFTLCLDKSRVVVIKFQSRDPDLAGPRRQLDPEGYQVWAGRAAGPGQGRRQIFTGRIDELRKEVSQAECR